MSGYKGHNNLHVLDAFANEEVPALDMLHAPVVLGIVRHVASALAIRSQRRGPGLTVTKALDEFTQVDHVLRRLGKRDDLGLAGRERDTRLLARPPRGTT